MCVKPVLPLRVFGVHSIITVVEQDSSTDIDGHLNARLVQLDLGNIVPGSPPHSPLDKSARWTNGVSPGRSGGAGPPAGSAAPAGASNLRSMSDMRKAKFKKLLDQQVGHAGSECCFSSLTDVFSAHMQEGRASEELQAAPRHIQVVHCKDATEVSICMILSVQQAWTLTKQVVCILVHGRADQLTWVVWDSSGE